MANPQYSSTENTPEVPYYDVDMFADDASDLEEETGAASVSSRSGSAKAVAEGLARRQLEERREAQRLRRLISDYAWDDQDI